MLGGFVKMHQTIVFFALFSLVLFTRLFAANSLRSARELVRPPGCQTLKRTRAHLTSLRERRRFPEGNPGGRRRKILETRGNFGGVLCPLILFPNCPL